MPHDRPANENVSQRRLQIMRKAIKILILTISKHIGLFHVTKYLTRNALQILCYHNISDGDEASWQPGLYIDPNIFEQRMELIKKRKFNTLSLDEAMDLLHIDRLPHNSIVITIDDGWYFIKKYAHKVLKGMDIPYTIYITSYYSERETPIFNLIIPYMLWKSVKSDFTDVLDDLEIEVASSNIEEISSRIVEYGYVNLNNEERNILLETLGEKLCVDYHELAHKRIFNLLTKQEIMELASDGVDIQLHTHRHTFPLSASDAMKEIDDNRQCLEPMIDRPLVHFCYPSGEWSESQFKYLESKCIRSATTCDSGFNYPQTNAYRLCRFLDSDEISPIEFEAELFGYLEIARRIRGKFRSSDE